ncbi:MAG: hypothetical protein HFE86_03515 [Clostridiales bacterium]|nr:hypothetical protein [Clostridiales bacterium]
MKRYKLSHAPSYPLVRNGSPLSRPKGRNGKTWGAFIKTCLRVWAGCALAAALLLASGCALEDTAAQRPEPASPTSSVLPASGMEDPSEPSASKAGPASHPAAQSPASHALTDVPGAAGIVCDIPEDEEPDWDSLLFYEKGETAAHIEVRPEWDSLSADDSKVMIYLTNKGGKGLLYTPSYRLERQTEAGWESLAFRPDAAVPSQVCYLRPGSGKGRTYSLTDLAEPARPGLYRIFIGGDDLGLSCTFTLRESENLGPKIDAAAAYGDQILEQENGRVAVIPEQRRYPVGTRLIRASYVNDSDAGYGFSPDRADFALEKKQPNGQWARVKPAGKACIPAIAALIRPHGSAAKEFDLGVLPQNQLTAGEYRVLEGIPGELYPPAFIFHFSLIDEAP